MPGSREPRREEESETKSASLGCCCVVGHHEGAFCFHGIVDHYLSLASRISSINMDEAKVVRFPT